MPINSTVTVTCNNSDTIVKLLVNDNNINLTPELAQSVASFESAHNNKEDAHEELFSSINAQIEEINTALETKAELDDIPMRLSELTNDTNFINNTSNLADTNLSNLTNYGQQQIKTIALNAVGDKKSVPFCINSGSIDNTGNANCLSYSGSTITLNTNSPVILCSADGSLKTISTDISIDVASLIDGVYNIFGSTITKDLSIFKNTIYRQFLAPLSPNANDVWLDTSTRPLIAFQYDGTSWQEFTGVPIGSCEVSSGMVTEVRTFPYNYTEKLLVSDACLPSNKYIDYTLGASGATYTAPANGWICARFVSINGRHAAVVLYKSPSGETAQNSREISADNSYYSNLLTAELPVKKGDVVGLGYSEVYTTYSGYSNMGISFIYANGEELEA